MGLHRWDLLGDMGCKDNGIHRLCIPEGDRGATALCGWRRERTSYLSLQNTQCLPPHVLLLGLSPFSMFRSVWMLAADRARGFLD